jgi:predicted kinase
VRRRSSATAAQTRAYAKHADALAPQLRREIATVPATPHGDPVLVLVMGLPGVGKSHAARLLCVRLGAAHVASDELRTRLFIAPSYAEEENRAVFAAAGALVDELLRDGHRVVLDATNLVARNRAGYVDAARRRGAPVVYVRVTAPDADVRARLAARTAARAAGDHSDADALIYERMRDRPFEAPAEGYVEIANGDEVAAAVERVAKIVETTART